MTINNNKAKILYNNYVISNYNKINVKAGKCLYNFRCQKNAVDFAKKNKNKKLAMCFYLDEYGDIFIHFINFHKGKYVDNTLGVWSNQLDYYFIRWIKNDEMFNIDDIFTSFREDLRRVIGWWLRLTSNYVC